MTLRLRRGPSKTPRPERSVRRAIVGLVAAAGIAFAVVATGSVLAARHIARAQELDTSVRSARAIGNAVFAPVLPAAIGGDADAIAFLDRAVRLRSRDGAVVRVMVWGRDKTVIYSDDHALIGRKFSGGAAIDAALAHGTTTVGLSGLDEAEDVAEPAELDHLVETYIPLTLDDGTTVVFETYSTDARLRSSENRLTSDLVPLSVGALLVLLLTQLPVSVWLVRRVGRAQQDRTRLLASALAASARERRNIARDLHDEVVQDLAGAGYALGALIRSTPAAYPPEAAELLTKASAAVERSVHDLRGLIVDLHPPDVTAGGLENALHDLGSRLRASTGIESYVQVDLPDALGPGVAETVYRCAREFLVNIAKHASATCATVELTGDANTVRLLVTDDGRGIPPGGWDRRAEGHVGLVLLAEASEELGGKVTVLPGIAGGTVALLVVPTRGSERS
jgi:two-component system, NarL family, sensor kinase